MCGFDGRKISCSPLGVLLLCVPSFLESLTEKERSQGYIQAYSCWIGLLEVRVFGVLPLNRVSIDLV